MRLQKTKYMKRKMLQLLLLFLVTGLLVSSKGLADNSSKCCKLKCIKTINTKPAKKAAEKKKQFSGYAYALAPGSYILTIK